MSSGSNDIKVNMAKQFTADDAMQAAKQALVKLGFADISLRFTKETDTGFTFRAAAFTQGEKRIGNVFVYRGNVKLVSYRLNPSSKRRKKK